MHVTGRQQQQSVGHKQRLLANGCPNFIGQERKLRMIIFLVVLKLHIALQQRDLVEGEEIHLMTLSVVKVTQRGWWNEWRSNCHCFVLSSFRLVTDSRTQAIKC